MIEILSYSIFQYGTFNLTVGSIILALIIFFLTKVLVYIINSVILKRYFKKRDIDFGRSYAIRSIIKYVIYFLSIILIMKIFGAQLSVLLLGSAGLLVGIGFGLQNTFNDFLSGLILLVEGNVEVGDIVVIDGMVGVIQKIGLRTSQVKTRDMISIIIPNSKLVGQNVTNWSHNQSPARFQIDFGVSYNSDIDQVEKVVLDTINKSEDVLEKPGAMLQLLNFGESSVDFRLYFFSDEFFYIEKVKSNLRKEIFKELKRHKIEIPYPQRDVWVKNQPLPTKN